MLPHTSKKISKIIRDEDPRGSIISLINDIKVSNISIITSFPKTFRSNHLHKKDWHYMYVLDGIMEYFFKKNNKIFYIKLKKGDLVFTPPKELHATYFPIKTTLLVASKNKRDKKTYEKDTIREKLIDFENIKSIKKHAKKIK
jgi:cupin superfamily acireductone dioxygenase involved in methionine salvage|tara:strand:+ start:60 stop:488 length:429 start_codon:yes stop_codon:yes gene_type:complete